MPVALAAVSAVGLLSALFGDGIWDWVSWLALSTPIVVSLWHGLQGCRRKDLTFSLKPNRRFQTPG